MSSRSDVERATLDRLAAGEVADFTGVAPKPVIRSGALREAALKGGAPCGVRVRNARIEGALDLSCVALPALTFEECDLAGKLDVSNARLGALSLEKSRIGHVFARGAIIDGPFDFSDCSPLDGEAWIDASKTRIRGGVLACRAKLKVPPRRPKDKVLPWDRVFALRMSECEIIGSLMLIDGFVADGGVCLDEASVTGTFSMRNNALLIASEGDPFHPGDALHAGNFRCGGQVSLNFGFRAEGRVWIQNSHIASRLLITGQLSGVPGPGYDWAGRVFNSNSALVLEATHIGAGFGLTESQVRGGVSLKAARIGADAYFPGTTITNQTDDGSAIALLCDQLQVTDDLTLGPGFAANGKVTMTGARIGGDLDVTRAKFNNPAGVALDVRRARITGRVRPPGAETASGIEAAGRVLFGDS